MTRLLESPRNTLPAAAQPSTSKPAASGSGTLPPERPQGARTRRAMPDPPNSSGTPAGDFQASNAELTVSLDLVRQAQGGQHAALNRLFERYYDRVRRVVRLRLGRQLRASLDSADILQETFIAAVRSFDKFEMRDEASLINWLSKLAERQIMAAADYHGARKRDRRREIAMPSTPGSGSQSGFVPQLADDATQPLDGLAETEQIQIVEDCIQDLEPEHRELVILRNYVGASWETVAEQTGRPSAAAARMMHARAMIELTKLVRTRGVSD